MATVQKKSKTIKLAAGPGKRAVGKSIAADASLWARTRRLVFPRARVLLALFVVCVLGWALQLVWQRVAPGVIYQEPYVLTALASPARRNPSGSWPTCGPK